MSPNVSRRTKLLAAAGMILTTIIWGSAFVVMKNSVDVIPPTYLLALRFTLAAIGLGILFFPLVRRPTRSDFKCGAVLGFRLFGSYFFQTYGLKYTTASKNAFITTLYVILVPFINWGINRLRPGKNNLFAAVAAVIGLALITLEGDLGVNRGDVLTLICSISFSLHMVFIARYTKDHDPTLMTFFQMAVSAALCWLVAPVLEGGFSFSVLGDPSIAMGILYLAFFSSMLGFLLQTVGQKYLSANTSSILLSFESVFGLVFAVIFLDDPLTARLLLGCALMFGAVILSEYKHG